MSSSGGAQHHQPDGLNLSHFASTEDDSLFNPTAADQGYRPDYRFQTNSSEQLENLRQSASPQFHTSTLPHHSTSTETWGDSNLNRGFSDFALYPTATDPNLFDYESKGSVPSGSINPADLMNPPPPHPRLSSQHNTPPLHIHSSQQSTSQPVSASLSSANPSGGFEWDSVNFAHHQSYRKAPSEYSDISSAAASPFLQNQEFSEHPSPLLQGTHIQQGSMQEFLNAGASPGESFGLDQFSLNERDISPHVSPRISPASGLHSGANSPYMLPQNNQYLAYVPPMGQTQDMNNFQLPPQRSNGLGLDRGGPGDDDIFPQINVIFAPPQRQPTFPGKPGHTHDDSALSPPAKSKSNLLSGSFQ